MCSYAARCYALYRLSHAQVGAPSWGLVQKLALEFAKAEGGEGRGPLAPGSLALQSCVAGETAPTAKREKVSKLKSINYAISDDTLEELDGSSKKEKRALRGKLTLECTTIGTLLLESGSGKGGHVCASCLAFPQWNAHVTH